MWTQFCILEFILIFVLCLATYLRNRNDWVFSYKDALFLFCSIVFTIQSFILFYSFSNVYLAHKALYPCMFMSICSRLESSELEKINLSSIFFYLGVFMLPFFDFMQHVFFAKSNFEIFAWDAWRTGFVMVCMSVSERLEIHKL